MLRGKMGASGGLHRRVLEQNQALCRSEARGYVASLAQAHLRQKILNHQDPLSQLTDIHSATNLGIIPPPPPCAGPPAITDDPILAELLQAAKAAGEEHISARHAKFQGLWLGSILLRLPITSYYS